MSELFKFLSPIDFLGLLIFIISWLCFEFITDFSGLGRESLSGLMAEKRRQWMSVLAERELRMIDTQILNGLQQGSAFFASSSILAIGGCFALLGSTDTVLQIYRDLPMTREFSRGIWELKVLGLAVLFAYTFFKFGWSYRLFNYCSILIGAVPVVSGSNIDERMVEARRAAEINVLAGRHFTSGLRGIFFALGYMGWFVGPLTFICATLFVLLVLIRRQYFSHARKVLI
ncbi:MAG: DUF599 family protein [Acidiferrobacterales bacterium]|nr:DUF599 family protein [Acidiferrobacterales bacterium]